MLVHVARDHGLTPGAETWFELAPDELVFFVSASGVTVLGACALESAWQRFLDRGLWRYHQPGGIAASITYVYQEYDPGAVVRLDIQREAGRCYLSPRHFELPSMHGLQSAAASSIASGWSYHGPTESVRILHVAS